MVLEVIENPPTFKAVRWNAEEYGAIDNFIVEMRQVLNDVSVVAHRIEPYTHKCGMPSERHVISMSHENALGAHILRLVIPEETGYVVVAHPGTSNSIPRIQFFSDAEFAFAYLRYDASNEIVTEP